MCGVRGQRDEDRFDGVHEVPGEEAPLGSSALKWTVMRACSGPTTKAGGIAARSAVSRASSTSVSRACPSAAASHFSSAHSGRVASRSMMVPKACNAPGGWPPASGARRLAHRQTRGS